MMGILGPDLEPYVSESEAELTVSTSWSQILPANSRRVAILFVNTSSTEFSVWPFPLSGNTGTRFVVPPTNTPPNFLLFSSESYGGLVREPWFGRALGAITAPPRVVEWVSSIDYVDALSHIVANPG